jgi:hypothetical protein
MDLEVSSGVAGGRKRSFEMLVGSDYAKYGCTQEVITCGVISLGWPSWALAASLRGFQVVKIVIKDQTWYQKAAAWFPNAEVTLHQAGAKSSVAFTKIKIWLSDIDPPRSFGLWSSEATVIVTGRRARHVSGDDWKMNAVDVSHSPSGGVTDGQWTFYVYLKGSTSVIPPISPVGFRDLTSILDSKVGGLPCPAPCAENLDSKIPRVVQLRPSTFFVGGLLPWDTRNLFVITPCVYSPTGWVRRRINNKVFFDVLDIPDKLIRDLNVNQARSLIQDTTFTPLKVLLRILDSLSWEDVEVRSNNITTSTDKPILTALKLSLSNVAPKDLNDISIAMSKETKKGGAKRKGDKKR